MSKFEVFDRCDANAIRHDLALIAKRFRVARVERSLSPRDLAEQAWRKNANQARAYPADLRLPAKKEILIDLRLWQPIGSASAEKHGY